LEVQLLLEIKQVSTKEQINTARRIFKEYEKYIGVDLKFQNFKKELENLKSEYSPPKGCILLAFFDGDIVGCVALREFKSQICEMKRLYVKNEFRGKGIGKTLVELVIQKAKEVGYSHMRLDTLSFMKEAIALYYRFGFKEIKPYRYNPIPGAQFFELNL
jgi:predicted N-acetyltransferase YhbS